MNPRINRFSVFALFAILIHAFTFFTGITFGLMNTCLGMVFLFQCQAFVSGLWWGAYSSLPMQRPFIGFSLVLVRFALQFAFCFLFFRYACIDNPSLLTYKLRFAVFTCENLILLAENMMACHHIHHIGVLQREQRLRRDDSDNDVLGGRPFVHISDTVVCRVAEALLQANVAPYVALDIVDLLVAGSNTFRLPFEQASAHHHYRKIKRIEQIQRLLV